jgi:hypothetical protein
MRRAHVIGPGWSSHHRPTALATLTATCDITRDGTGPGTFDPATGKTTPPARIVVATDAACRVQARPTRERAVLQGDQVVTIRSYLVSLPHDVPLVEVDDLIEITDAVDADLAGRTLRVLDAQYGSEQWQRNIVAQDDLG